MFFSLGIVGKDLWFWLFRHPHLGHFVDLQTSKTGEARENILGRTIRFATGWKRNDYWLRSWEIKIERMKGGRGAMQMIPVSALGRETYHHHPHHCWHHYHPPKNAQSEIIILIIIVGLSQEKRQNWGHSCAQNLWLCSFGWLLFVWAAHTGPRVGLSENEYSCV